MYYNATTMEYKQALVVHSNYGYVSVTVLVVFVPSSNPRTSSVPGPTVTDTVECLMRWRLPVPVLGYSIVQWLLLGLAKVDRFSQERQVRQNLILLVHFLLVTHQP
jgi:hypothetical protein